MKLAIVSVTAQGAKLGQYLNMLLAAEYSCAVYEKAGRQSGGQASCFESSRTLINAIWQQFDGFIFIMSTGIVVRQIAGLLRHKSVDPAVLVLDELGNNCISLLAGHLGGANTLTRIVAGLAGANPVITTASDVNGLVVPDTVSKQLNFAIESYTMLQKVNAATVAGEQVDYFVDPQLPEAKAFIAQAGVYGLDFSLYREDIRHDDGRPVVFLSERPEKKLPYEHVLYLRPKSIIAGIGCRRGKVREELHKALDETLAQSGYSPAGLQAITSAWVKQDEQGLLELAKALQVPIYFYDAQALHKSIVDNKLDESEFVKKEIGVGNVCEAAILAHSQQAVIVKNRQSYGGITVALARVNFLL